MASHIAAVHDAAACNPYIFCLLPKHGMQLLGSLRSLTQRCFSLLIYIASTMPPKGRGRKAQGSPTTASPKKRDKKTASKKQAPVASSTTLEHLSEQDLESGNQTTDMN